MIKNDDIKWRSGFKNKKGFYKPAEMFNKL